MKPYTLAQTLIHLVEEHGEDTGLSRFVAFVEEKHLQFLLPAVVRRLEAMEKARKAYDELHIVTARPISPELMEKIRAFVGLDEETTYEHRVDKALIGGFVATHDGRHFDGSLRGALTRLRQRLAGSAS